jgi:YesN/AraC family two-component response regulator
MKILIVDDEEISLSSVRRILRWRGIRNVEVCDNGRDAIRKIRETEFDIVLLDLLMPDVDGLQVLESAKPYRPHTEFVILTAVDDIPTTVKAIRWTTTFFSGPLNVLMNAEGSSSGCRFQPGMPIWTYRMLFPKS